jgi:hypothetical protein
MRSLSALALALVLGPLAVGQDKPDPFALERLLGPDALFVASLPRTPAAAQGYDGSELRKLWEHPEVRAFLAPFEAWLQSRKTQPAADLRGRQMPPFNEMSREFTGLTIDELWDLLQGPVGIAVYDLPMGPRHSLDLVVALGAADGASLAKNAAKIREALGRHAGPLKEGEFQKDGATLHELGTDAFTVYWAVLKQTLFVTTTQARLEQIAASAAKPGPSILDDPSYKNARARVSPDSGHFFSAWIGVSAILKRFKAEIGDEGLGVMQALGVADLDAAAMAVGFENGLVVERYALTTTRQDRGLLKLLAGGAGKPAVSAPSGAVAWAHSGLDLAASYDVLIETAKAIPELEDEVLSSLKAFEEEAGFKIRDLLAGFGEGWTSWSVFPEGGGALPFEVVAVPLRDPAKLGEAAEKFGAFLGMKADTMPFRGRTIRLASLPLDEADVFGHMTGGLLLPSFPMAWYVEKDVLYYSSNPLALKRHILHGASAKPLSSDPRYAVLAARAPAAAQDAFFYLDTGRWLNVFYSTIDPLATAGRDFVRDPQTGQVILDLARLPLGETLSELVGGSLTSKRTEPGALLLESRSKAGVSFTSIMSGAVMLGGAAGFGFAMAMRPAAAIEVDGVAGNELLASVSLQLLKQAQETFKNSDSDRNGVADYWTRDVAGLWGLKDAAGQPIFLVDPALAQSDPDGIGRYGLGASPRSGYHVKAMVTDADGEPYAKDEDKDGSAFTNKTRWAVTAWPALYGGSGRMTFIVGQDGKVWKKDTQGKPADRWPGKDPAAEGWEPAE